MQNYSRQEKVIYPVKFHQSYKEFYIVDNDHTNISEICYKNSHQIYHNLACRLEVSKSIIIE